MVRDTGVCTLMLRSSRLGGVAPLKVSRQDALQLYPSHKIPVPVVLAGTVGGHACGPSRHMCLATVVTAAAVVHVNAGRGHGPFRLMFLEAVPMAPTTEDVRARGACLVAVAGEVVRLVGETVDLGYAVRMPKLNGMRASVGVEGAAEVEAEAEEGVVGVAGPLGHPQPIPVALLRAVAVFALVCLHPILVTLLGLTPNPTTPSCRL